MHAYLELKIAWSLFNKAPDQLSDAENTRLQRIARRQSEIESCLLAAPEAAGVVIPETTLAAGIAEVRNRYTSEEEFTGDLERHGLDPITLAESIRRDLCVEAVLNRVSAACPPASTVDAEIYYRLHPASFTPPETRRLSHILITWDTPAQKQQAIALLSGLRNNIDSSEAFAKAALTHSQCPTAMNGGELGTIRRGQLFAELEPAAFALAEGALSPVLESPVGLHLLRCDAIVPGRTLAFAEISAQLIAKLSEQRQVQAQKAWIEKRLAETQQVA